MPTFENCTTVEEVKAEFIRQAKIEYPRWLEMYRDGFLGGKPKNWGEVEVIVPFFDANEANEQDELFDALVDQIRGIEHVGNGGSGNYYGFSEEFYEENRRQTNNFKVQKFHKNDLYTPFLDKPIPEFVKHLRDKGIKERSIPAYLAHMTRRQQARHSS